jgi:hypothetical protein
MGVIGGDRRNADGKMGRNEEAKKQREYCV